MFVAWPQEEKADSCVASREARNRENPDSEIHPDENR